MANDAGTVTHEDVNLMIKLYELRREPRMREARQWFASSFKVRTLDEFHALCPNGSEQNASYRMIVTYWDMVASFVTAGVLNQHLFFQSGGEMLFVWERIRDIVPPLREAYVNRTLYRNVEQVATAFIAWWTEQAPGAYEAFSKRIRG
jgi:hypothetical protein